MILAVHSSFDDKTMGIDKIYKYNIEDYHSIKDSYYLDFYKDGKNFKHIDSKSYQTDSYSIDNNYDKEFSILMLEDFMGLDVKKYETIQLVEFESKNYDTKKYVSELYNIEFYIPKTIEKPRYIYGKYINNSSDKTNMSILFRYPTEIILTKIGISDSIEHAKNQLLFDSQDYHQDNNNTISWKCQIGRIRKYVPQYYYLTHFNTLCVLVAENIKSVKSSIRFIQREGKKAIRVAECYNKKSMEIGEIYEIEF